MGWLIMLEANVDPRGMTDAFRKLQAHEQQQKLRDVVPGAFSTHPDVEQRIARLEKKRQKIKTTTVFLDLSNSRPLLEAAAK
jgi:predicted Zn-dependent protease